MGNNPDRYDRISMHMPWHDPKFRQAVAEHELAEKFLSLCKTADEKGMVLSPIRQQLRKTFERKLGK